MTVVLIGPMAAGKSSIGRRAAKLLHTSFADTDARIVAEHGPISDLFATRGEAAFREIERAVVAEALRGGGVVALGGGAVLHPDTGADLADHAVVLLTVSAEAVAERIGGTSRPLLTDGVASWQRIHEQRRPRYEALADVVFDTSGRPMMQVADDLAAWARQQGQAALEPVVAQ